MGIISDDTDTYLMLKVQRDDDRKAFTELYLRYNPRLKRYFSSKLYYTGYGDKSKAEDYAQEIFLKIWKNRDKYRPDSEFSRYIFSIAKNYWIDCRRKTESLPPHVSLEQISTYSPEDDIQSKLPIQKDETDNKLLSEEITEQIKIAVETLPVKQKRVFILTYYEGMSYKQVSLITECSINTVKTLRQEAREKVKKILENYFKNKIHPFTSKNRYT